MSLAEKQKESAQNSQTEISMTHSLKHSVDLECSDNNRPSKLSKIEHSTHIAHEDDEEEEEKEMTQNPRNRIQRYFLAIEYIGTRFSGSQKQLTCRTVVGALEVTKSPHHIAISIHSSNLLLFCRKLLLNLLATPSLSLVQVEL